MNEQLRFLLENLPNLIIGFPSRRPGGLLLSVFLALFAIGFGFLIALVVGSGRHYSETTQAPPTRRYLIGAVCQLYIETIRGLPLLLLLVLLHTFGNREPQTSALIALTLYSSAYQAEIVRAGLQTVPQSLVDFARTLGGTPWQTWRQVRLPYALRVMLPAFTGEAISLFKDTSVVLILGVAELMTVSRIILSSSGETEPYWVSLSLLVGLLYFSVAFPLSKLAEQYERRWISAERIHSLAYER